MTDSPHSALPGGRPPELERRRCGVVAGFSDVAVNMSTEAMAYVSDGGVLRLTANSDRRRNADAPSRGALHRVFANPERQAELVRQKPALNWDSTQLRPSVNLPPVTQRHFASPGPCMPRKTGAETGLTHTKPLFRVNLTPWFPVGCGIKPVDDRREPKYLDGIYHEGKGSSFDQKQENT